MGHTSVGTPLSLARYCYFICWLILLPTSVICHAAPSPFSGVYEQIQKQFPSPSLEKEENPLSASVPLISALLPIPETPTQLSTKIAKLQEELSRFYPLDANAYKKRLAAFSWHRLESELRELTSQQLDRREDIDRIERLLLKHARERSNIQKTLNEITDLNNKHQKKIHPDGITTDASSKYENLVEQLEGRARLLPLSNKRYELELQLTQFQLDQILQKKSILEALLESRIKNLRKPASLAESCTTSLSDNFFDDPSLNNLACTEQELRNSLTKARKDLLLVQRLGFNLEFQMKELGHVSEVYELLESQRECLMRLDLTNSGKSLIHQLRLKQTILSEKIRSLDLTMDNLSRRRHLETIINKIEGLIPLAVELWELEKELFQHHKRVMSVLEQRRMWMAVAPALTPSQLFSALIDVKEQLKLLQLELDTDHFSKLYLLILFLLIFGLILSHIFYQAQKRFLNNNRKSGSLSVIQLFKLVAMIIIGSTPIPIGLALSGIVLKETSGYTFTFGQVLQSTALMAFGWTIIAAFGRESVQQQIGVRQEGYHHWHRQANILGIMSITGLLLGGFAEYWYSNPYDDRITQVTLLICALVQACIEWKLIKDTRPEIGYYSLKFILTLIFPMSSLLIVSLATLGYNLAAWAIFSQKQVIMLVCGLTILVYELSLYLLYARTRKITLEHALHERRQASGDIGPEDALEVSRSHIGDLQLQGKRLLQLVSLSIFFFSIAWLTQDFTNLIEPIGKIKVWPFTNLDSNLSVALGGITQATIILLLTLLLSRNLTGLIRLSVPAKFLAQPARAYTLSRFSIYTLWVSSTLLILNTLGISWEKLQWLIIAVTVGIGFGLQEIVANFFSGLIILLERPFRVGDTVTVGTVEGEVKQIHIRATVIEDFDRKELIVPNKTLVTGEVTNWSFSSNVLRVVLWFGVAHGSDNDLVFQLLMLAADECQKALREPPPEVYFIEYTEHAERYELRIFVNHVDDRYPAKNQVNTRVKELFAENGIVVAHAQQDVHLVVSQEG